MSVKWIRNQRWADKHLTGWLSPVRWVLHTFSLVRTAIVLLSGVVLFAVAASVPIGLLALIPTYLVYSLVLAVTLGMVVALPSWWVQRRLASAGAQRPARFAVGMAMVLVLGAAALWLWGAGLWPALRYDPSTGRGLRLFPDFVEQYRAVTVRRLPGLEMSEIEFYAWWPLTILLTLFVINLSVATIRRIEFRFVNLGVLMVHSGIILIALGSAYYGSLKREGDVLLMAGEVDQATGRAGPGPEEGWFNDNLRTVLRIQQRGNVWEMRLLNGLPRYNAYNLDVLGEPLGAQPSRDHGALDIALAQPARPPGTQAPVDSDIQFRVVGYSPYTRLAPKWRPLTQGEARAAAALPGYKPMPLRLVELVAALEAGEQVRSLEVSPASPAERHGRLFNGAVNVEYTRGVSDERWAHLSRPIPAGAQHAMVMRLKGGPERLVAVQPGQVERLGEGDDGWTLQVLDLLPEPPFPIITPGFEGTTSSVLICRVTPPKSMPEAKPFSRYVYSRYPELSQDLVEIGSNQPPVRRRADPALDIAYIDDSVVNAYLDEATTTENAPAVRAIIRVPNREPVVLDSVAEGSSVPIVPTVSLRLGRRWPDARRVLVPTVVQPSQVDQKDIGTHRSAAIAVEISLPADARLFPGWSVIHWLPFSQYGAAGAATPEGQPVTLPDGREVRLVFGRLMHPLPGFTLRLMDFEMVPYPHSTMPRDFRSELELTRYDDKGRRIKVEKASTSLNEPLKVNAFSWSDDRAWPANALGWLSSQFGPGRYKFSQSGWDAQGWERTRNQRGGPVAAFTILGVGNNPGIYVIAAGSVLMGIGIPWAFYLKPYLLRRRKLALQLQIAAGTGGAGATSARRAGAGANGASRASQTVSASSPAREHP